MSTANGHIEQIVARLADQVERRFLGKYRGFVVDNEDPELLGRLKVRVPSVLGDEVVTGWAMPCVPSGGMARQGHLFVPDVEAGVWIEFEEGDPEFPVWVGCFWSAPGGESEVPTPVDEQGAPADDPASPPARRIVRTTQGHTIQFDDSDDALRIILSDGDEENRIVFSDDGLTITNKDNAITMTDDGVTVEDANGNAVTQDSSGTTIEDGNGNTITLGNASGYPAGPGIELNGSSRVCLEGLLDWLISHTHIGNMGAPCPLNPADIAQLTAKKVAPGGGILSDKVNVA